MDAVGAADDRRVPELLRADGGGPLDRRDARQQELARVAQLQREGGVDDVGRRQAVVEPAALLADELGHRLGEGEHVVVGTALDLRDPGDVDAGLRADGLDGLERDDAQLGPGGHRGDLHVQPPLEFALVRPHGADGGAGIARDQAGVATFGRRGRPRSVYRRVWRSPAGSQPPDRVGGAAELHPIEGLTDLRVTRTID